MNNSIPKEEVIPRASVFLFVFGVSATDFHIERVGGGVKASTLVLIGSLLLSLLLYLRANDFRVRVPHIGTASKVYLVYLAVALCSSLWAPSTASTVFQVCVLFAIWVCAILTSAAPPQLVVRYIVYIAAVTSVISLALIPVSHGFAYQPASSSGSPELRGAFYHQLRLGQYAGGAVALIFLVWMNGQFKKVFPNVFPVLAALPIIALAGYLAHARLYTAFTVLAFLLVYSYSKKKIPRILSTFGIIAAVVISIGYFGQFETDLNDAGVDTTLTGRVRLWEVTTEQAETKPLLGHGYGSFDSPIYDSLWGIYRPAHPHNSYIQAFFENGYVGMFLIIVLSVVHLRRAASPDASEGRYSYTMFMVASLVLGSLTGANYASNPSNLFCLALWLISARETRDYLKKKKLWRGV